MADCSDPAEKAACWRIIESDNELLLRLINDILDFSKVESGILDRRRENFNLGELCDEFYRMMQQKMADSKVALRVDKPRRITVLSWIAAGSSRCG